MSIKVDVHTNINDFDLTIERCNEIIQVLQTAYDNIRQEMYNYFLGKKHLKRTLILAGFMLLCFFGTKSPIFLYFVPISVVLSMLASIMSAEYMASQTRKQLHIQIQHYIQKREKLMRDKDFKAI